MRKSYTEKFVENKSAKRVRITMAVLYFIEIILTTFPFMWGDAGDGTVGQLTAFEIAVQPSGYANADMVKLAVMCGVFVVFPFAAFMCCILDRKTNVKNFVSAACCVICAVLITFGVGSMIAIGAVISLILYVVILFFTAQGFQASVLKEKQ